MSDKAGLKYIDDYFSDSRYRVSQHHIDSYDDFIHNKVPAIVADGNRSFVMLKTDKSPPAEFRVSVHSLRYARPTAPADEDGGADRELLPNICRAKGVSYALSLLATVTVTITDAAAGTSTDVSFDDVLIGRLPLMLHSSLCYLRDATDAEARASGEDPDDPGGYFITWGAEKVIVTQERGAPNVPVVARKKDGNGRLETSVGVRSARPENTVAALTAQVVVKEAEGGAVLVRVPGRFIADVDVAVVFRALGVETDAAIADHIAPAEGPRDSMVRDLLRPSLIRAHARGVWTQEQALDHLAPLTPYGSNLVSTRSDKDNSRGRTQAMYILRREMLLGVGEAFPDKAVYLGILVRRALLAHRGMEEESDREALRMKRMFTSGMLLTEIFAEAYAQFKSEATNRLDRAWYYGPWRGSGDIRRVVTRANVASIFRHEPVTQVMQSSMRGNWGGHGRPEEGGIVQDLSRLSWLQFLSHLRRTNNPLDRGLKIVDPHYLHPTQWGALCPVDSPDGANIGLTNNLALTCEVTAALDPADVIEALRSSGARPLEPARLPDTATVYVNGVPLFVHDRPHDLAAALRGRRRDGSLHRHTSVRLDVQRREVRVATDGGRCSRPLLLPPGLRHKAAPGWEAHLRDGRVEYVDADEADDIMLAWDAESFDPDTHTHCELHATAGLSVFESSMPFMQHNPGPRNVLAAQQGKQAAGLYTAAFRARIDTMGMVLNYPQLPLVHTRYEGMNAQVRHPGGVNTIVAFMTYTGFNMEDGVIINASAVERGLFSMTYLKNLLEEEDVSGDGNAIRFGNPTSAASLDSSGLPRANEPVVPGELLIGRTRRSGAGGFVPVDGAAARADERWAGYIADQVFVYDKPGRDAEKHGLKVAKVRYRKTRHPKPGDKLAARHAQKGCIGAAVPESMMPFTADGVVPDLIINPHAIPSRMTLGQFMECLCAKASCVTGDRVDGTAFEPPDYPALRKALEKSGFHAGCDEVMFAPDGQMLQGDIFVGPTYYQRLKQMVEDKVNYRGGRGARDNVTNQPVGGRARGGGLRMGEMEYNAVLAHGVMGMAAENTTQRSDGTSHSWADGHGAPAVYNEDYDYFRPGSAPACDKRFSRRSLPRAFVALQHELSGMCIDARLMPDAHEDELQSRISEHMQKSCGKDDPFA